MLVAFISPRGVSLRPLPDVLPLTWFVPIHEDGSEVLHVEPGWHLHEYVKADNFSYVERVPAR